MGKVEQRYLEAVLALADRARRQRKRLLAGAFVFIGAVAVVVFFLAMRADAHAKRADEEAARVKAQNEALAFQALQGRNAMRILAARKRQDDPMLVLALLREVEGEDIPKEWPELVSAALSQGVARMVWTSPGAPQAPVYDAAVSPDGERIVTASGDKTARIWSAGGEGEPLVLGGHEAALNSATMSPDGRRVVTASEDKTARVFDAIDGKELVVLRHDAEVQFAAFSPDGRRIVTASEDSVTRVWSADGTGEPLRLRGHADMVVAAAFHPEGTSLATAGKDNTVRVWDASSGAERLVLRGHEDKVMSVAFSPDGKRIASTSKDRTARIWNADGSGPSASTTPPFTQRNGARTALVSSRSMWITPCESGTSTGLRPSCSRCPVP